MAIYHATELQALRDLGEQSHGDIAFVSKRLSTDVNDDGGGEFVYHAGIGGLDDSATVIMPYVEPPDTTDDRWIRRAGGIARAEWFGAKGDNTANDLEPINDCLAKYKGVNLLADKTYRIAPMGTWTVISPKSGCRIEGAGMDKTTIRLEGEAGSAFIPAIQNYHENAEHYNQGQNNIVIRDLTIDCGYNASPKNETRLAIDLCGGNNLVERVKVKNFGVGSQGSECFVISLHLGTSNASPNNQVGTVRDCVITEPGDNHLVNYPNPDAIPEITCIMLQGRQQSEIKAIGGAIVGNRILNLPYGPNVQKSPLHGITIGECVGTEIADNEVINFDGAAIYWMSWKDEDVVVRGNRLLNVNTGVLVSVVGSGQTLINAPKHLRTQICDNVILLGRLTSICPGSPFAGVVLYITQGITPGETMLLADTSIERNFIRGVTTDNTVPMGVYLPLRSLLFDNVKVADNVLDVPDYGYSWDFGVPDENAIVFNPQWLYAPNASRLKVHGKKPFALWRGQGDKRRGVDMKLRAMLFALISGLSLASGADSDDGFKPIFNGKDLTGWDGDPQFWSVQDGAITGRTTKEKPAHGNTFIIWRDGALDDFELRLSYRTAVNNDEGFANSGVQYRSQDFGNWSVGGYQADIEAGPTFSGILYEERMTRRLMAERGEKVVWGADGKKQVVGSVGDAKAIQSAIKKDDWNDYVIIAQGYHLIHKINGHVTVDVTDNDPAKRARAGILALQLHAGPPMSVQFKDIRLKRLKLADAKKIVLVAGAASHGPGDHEHNAGVLLWKKCLDQAPGVVAAAYAHCNGWPKDPTAFDNADAVAVYSDGGGGHPFIQGGRLKTLGELMKQGVGLGCVHYAVEVPKDKGGPEFLAWTGGYFETDWSVNPHWEADFASLPQHPVTRGVKPFKMRDEWYYHMRFPENMQGVTPILSALPPKETLNAPDGPHSNNPHVRKAVLENKEPQHLLWVIERPDGGRGFGFTGGHFHKEWGHEDFRRVVLNALLWIAKAEVPPDGVASSLLPDDLTKNLDRKGR